MMLRFSLDLQTEADAIEKAVEAVLDDDYRTGDIYTEGTKRVSCSQMGKLIADYIK